MREKNNHIWKVSVYFSLVKYKLSLAVTLSAATGFFLYRNTPNSHLFFLVTGIFLLAAGSSVLNQYTERESDAIMARTMKRPIAAKKITPGMAKLVVLILLSSGIFLLCLNGFIPCASGCLGVILYNVFYTSMKKITVLAIIPGAFAGAIPPLIGYTSAGGTVFNDRILFFSAFMFLWQIPHFWLLLIRYRKEYQAAGFRTISDYLNEKQIKYLIFIWVLLSLICLILFSRFTGLLTNSFSILLIILNISFLIFFFRLLFISKGSNHQRNAFILFNSFSILIMFLLIAESLLIGI